MWIQNAVDHAVLRMKNGNVTNYLVGIANPLF
jgi:hypothetical protein